MARPATSFQRVFGHIKGSLSLPPAPASLTVIAKALLPGNSTFGVALNVRPRGRPWLAHVN